MSSRHETFSFAVVMMLFYSYLDFVDFYAQLQLDYLGFWCTILGKTCNHCFSS